jgi:hypothetical protein
VGHKDGTSAHAPADRSVPCDLPAFDQKLLAGNCAVGNEMDCDAESWRMIEDSPAVAGL